MDNKGTVVCSVPIAEVEINCYVGTEEGKAIFFGNWGGFIREISFVLLLLGNIIILQAYA